MTKENTELKLTPAQAKLKLEHFCAYQERSQQEAREKLYSYGLYTEDAESIICDLIENNFLNEERFTEAYCRGKFKLKHWGKLKIRAGLMQKRVPTKMIEKAIKGIDADEYWQTLHNLLVRKAALINEKNKSLLKKKLIDYAYSKGYEKTLTAEVLNFSGLLEK